MSSSDEFSSTNFFFYFYSSFKDFNTSFILNLIYFRFLSFHNYLAIHSKSVGKYNNYIFLHLASFSDKKKKEDKLACPYQ